MKKKIVGTIIVIAFIGLSYYGWNQSKPIDSDIKLQNIEALAQAEILAMNGLKWSVTANLLGSGITSHIMNA